MYQRLSTESSNRPAVRHELVRASFDREYLRRLQQRDPETERHFVEYFGTLLRLKLNSRLRDPQIINDLTQETFLRVLNTIRRDDGIQSAGALGGYVNSVCNNLLFELNRSQSREFISFDDFDPPDKHISAESALVSKESKELVRKVLEELPQRDRELLRMVFYEDVDRGAICRDYRISPEYLRVLVHRAKARFREYWLGRQGEAFPSDAVTGASAHKCTGA